MIEFKLLNIKFPIETGRWAGIPRQHRKYHLCKTGLGNEFHFLFICDHPEIKRFREKYVPQYYIANPSENKMKGMLTICHVQLYRNLSAFIKCVCRLL